MSKARTLANLISDNAELADGQISVAEVVGAAPTANPTFTGNIDAGDNVKIRLGDSDDLQLYHDGTSGNTFIDEGGSGSLFIRDNDNIALKKQSDNANMLVARAGAEVELYHNGSEKLATTSTGIQVTGNIANTTGDLTLDVAGDIILDSGGFDVKLKVDGTEYAKFSNYQNNFYLEPIAQDKDLIIRGNDGGSVITALTLDMSASGDAIFNSDVVLGSTGKLRSNGDDDSYLQFNQANTLRAVIGDSTRMIVTPTETVFNEDSADIDFRVESNNNSNMLFVRGGNDRVGVGTAGPEAVMHVYGDLKATYYRPLNASNQTSSNSLHFWKLGRIYLVGPDAAEIVLHGTKQGYGSSGNIVGKTTILLRGGTSATTLDGIFYSEGQTSAAPPPEVRYVSVGSDSFDIYVRHHTYSSLAHTVTTGGSWTAAVTNTGSGTAPSNSIAILAERSTWLGDHEVLRQNQTGTVINETSHDHDFRVESDGNSNMLFVDAGNNRVGIGLSNPSYPLEVAGQTKVGFDNDATSLLGTGYNGAFLHNGLNVPANTTTYTPHFEGTVRVSGAGYVSHMTVGTKRDGTNSWNNCGFIAYGGNDAGPTLLWEFSVNGQFNSPSTKNFKIKHPLAELNETHDLYHAAIEGPNADLIYRGVVTLVAGSATVNIDTESRMTEGTFVALTKDIQSFTSNETDWTPVRGSVSGNILTVEAQDNTSTASVSWMVVAKRNDFNVIDNETTDENGEFITERIQ